MKRVILKTIFCISVVCSMMACNEKRTTPYILPSTIEDGKSGMEGNVVSVPYSETGNLTTIPVKLNGEPMNMIFDTVCSGISLSLLEAQVLLKNGKLSESDLLGKTSSIIADGSSVEEAVVNIREIIIGEGDNVIVLKNKIASVAPNLQAPVLLGENVIKDMASVKINHERKTIDFYKK